MDRTARRLGVVVACVLVAAGCGDDGGSGETGFGSGEQFSITGALSQIPREFAADFEGNIQIYVADLLAAGEATGQSRPTGSTDADEATEWLGPMTGRSKAPVFMPVPFALLDGVRRSLGEYKDEVGFAVTDVDATIESRALPLSMMVLAGELEPAGSTEVADGVLTIGEGDDFQIESAERDHRSQSGQTDSDRVKRRSRPVEHFDRCRFGVARRRIGAPRQRRRVRPRGRDPR